MIKCFTGEMFQSRLHVMYKALFLCFLRSLWTTYLITLSLEKRIIVLEKVLNFGSKICTNPD